MVNLIISLAFVAFAVFLLNKKVPNTLLFLGLAILLALYYSISTGTSAAAETSGLLFLDIFEIFKEQLIKSFATVGLSMLPIYGYAMYMEKIGASAVLGKLVSKPVLKSRNPYFTGVFIAIVLCSIMRIAIVSAFAIMALLFSTLYPAMLRAGLSAKTTISAIFLGTCFDWGPADFVVAVVLGGAGESDIPGYFLNATIYVVPILIIIAALTSGFVMKSCDNKDGYILGNDAPEDAPEVLEQTPSYYAVFPLLPMILIIIFSPVFSEQISISVVAAVLISILFSLVIELMRKKDIKTALADVMAWIDGIGSGFANLFLMVASIQLFAAVLSKLEGFTWAVETILTTGMNGWLMLIIAGLFTILMAMLLGEPSAITAIIAGPVKTIAQSLGIPFYVAIFPIQTANAFRCLSIGTGPHMQYCCKQAECHAADIIKRTALPCLIIFATSVACSYFIL